MHTDLEEDNNEAEARYQLAMAMQMAGNFPGAMEHLTAARFTFNSLGDTYSAATCTSSLGMIHVILGEVVAGIAELEGSRSKFISIGHQVRIAEAALFLGSAELIICN